MPFVKQWRRPSGRCTLPRVQIGNSQEELVSHRFTRVVIVVMAGLASCRTASTIPNSGQTPATSASSPRPLDISYRISWGDPTAHLFDVQIDIAKVSGDLVELQMPVWSPGRYAAFFFARNVTQFSVTNGSSPVRWDRENGSLWRIYAKGESHLSVKYHVYANTLSGTFSVLDTAHANWNGPSTFMYVVDHKPDPVRLHIAAPAGWHIVNGDTRAVDQTDYLFENYDRLADSPTEVSPTLTLDTLRIDNRVYRAMVHHNGAVTPTERKRFLDALGKIVRYENTVFDPPPLEMYTFLFNLGYGGGDGMEHLYSTQCINGAPWREDAPLLAGITTAAHEYFHVWNMKRVRAAALGPFDYTRERYQPSLWVGEGWTQYYGQVALARSGVQPPEAIYAAAANIIRQNLTSPGRKEVSARMSSFEAPFFDGSRPEFEVNRAAWFSYYPKGAGIALYLDLYLRAHTNNRKSLDHAFRLLRDRTWGAPNASYYLQGRGYTEEDVVRAVSDVAGVDMHAWFDRFVGGTDDMDYDEVLGLAGMKLVRESTAAGAATWRVEPAGDASPSQMLIRDGWVSGKTSP
jgi:predicted metalloprotease with PDZ domain